MYYSLVIRIIANEITVASDTVLFFSSLFGLFLFVSFSRWLSHWPTVGKQQAEVPLKNTAVFSSSFYNHHFLFLRSCVHSRDLYRKRRLQNRQIFLSFLNSPNYLFMFLVLPFQAFVEWQSEKEIANGMHIAHCM